MLPNCLWNAYTWHELEDLILYGQWTNLHDRSQNGPKHVKKDYLVWSLTFIIHVITHNHVMWETMQAGTVSRLRFCRRSWGFKIYVRWNIMQIRKQTSVSHSSTESEISSLEAGLRLDGTPALDLWDLILLVLGNTNQSHKERGDLLMNKREVRSTPHTIQIRKQSQGVINDLDNVDFVPSNVNSSHQEALLYVFEDNEVVIKMIIKRRSPTMRHVSSTHRVALDWLFDRINLDPKIQIKYINTKNQLADILIKGNFTRDEWNHLLCLFNISHFSSTICSEVISKRTQKDSGEERVTAKSKPMMNLVSRCSERTLDVLASTASESSGKTRYESQLLLSSWTEQHLRTGRLIKDAFSSSYSEWNADKNGLLKSGNLMNWWKEEQGDLLMNSHPVCSHSTRTDLLLMTMIWTLTPSQNQTCR